MRVRHLAVEEFRSYPRAEITLAPGITAFVGPNGAGKTNLLEAIHIAARGDTPRSHDDTEIVRWGAEVGRVTVDLARAEDERRIEVVLFGAVPGQRRKARRWLLDGAGKRADDAIGELAVVAFFPEDVQLLGEAPGARRRYLDTMVSQVDRRHRTETREYQRVLEQRNALLHTLRESGLPAAEAARSEELAFWNVSLCRLAGSIASRRAHTVAELRGSFHAATTRFHGDEALDIAYAGQVDGTTAEERTERYTELLKEKGEREIWQATTLIGPHREDLSISARGRDLPSFASRGEHRSAVLALKLAEADWVRERKGDTPVFLLDDVLSELDARRRDALVNALPDDAQVLVTAAFPGGLPPALLARATIRDVTDGEVR